MQPIIVSSSVFALIFTGALAGMIARRVLPQDHLGTDAKESVRIAIGLIVTMTGLVLGMLVSSAKTYYDSQKNVVAEMASEVILLDNALTLYGPEAKPVRKEARQFVEDAVYRIWPEDMKSFQLRPKNNGKRIIAELDLLVPKDEAQASAKVQVATLTQSLTKEYWLMFLETEQTAISMPLLMVLTSWLIAIFVSFGLFAPPNPTVMVTLIVCGLAASAAIFLIMEMYSPFSGMLKISPTAVHDALTQMAIDQ